MKNWYSIQNRGAGIGEISVYEDIGAFGITAKEFIDDLKALGSVRQLTVRINSGGGSVFDGFAIYNALRSHKATVTTSIEGLAASIASVIAMAGDTVTMAENALLMIHDPSAISAGSADEIRKTAELLDKVKKGIVAAYTRKTGMSEGEISQMMAGETWFDSAEALQQGFIDEVTAEVQAAASLDLSRFDNLPEQFRQRKEDKTMNMKTQPQDSVDFKNREQKRREEIRNIFASFGDEHRDVLDACLDDFDVTVDQARARLLDAMGRDSGPLGQAAETTHFITVNDRLDEFKDAAVDALLIRSSVPVKEPHPASRDLRRMSLVAMAETVLKKRNVKTWGMDKSAIIKNAITHSSSDFPSLLSNVASKSLMVGYENEPTTHTLWTKEVLVPDFKTHDFVQFSEAPDFDQVPEDGEYKYGTFGESKEQVAILTYGKLFSISRQAIINDDLQAFTRIPQAFGASARRKESDIVYAVLTANANMADGNPLFDAAHSNLVAAGSGAAPSVSTIGAARSAMRKQKGIQGVQYLNIMPAFLIVPVALEDTANVLMVSEYDPDITTNSRAANPVRNIMEVISDPRLDANSTTAWYMTANPNVTETVVIAHLDGLSPFTFEERVGFEVDGLEVKARLDSAAKALEWRGVYKNAGA